MDITVGLVSNTWFARQSANLRSALIRDGRIRQLRAGQWVYGEGDENTGLCAVLSGSLRLEASAGPQRDVLFGIALAGSIFGQSSRRGGGPRLITARANQPASVMLVSDDALDRIGNVEPTLWRAMSELVYEQLDAAVRLNARLLVLRPRARVAMRIASIAKDGVAYVAQGDLAELTGLSRKAVNGHLAALATPGILKTGYGCIRVLDPVALARIASP